MSLPETGLPPRGITDWQQRQIQLAVLIPQHALDHVVRVVDQGSVAGEERSLAGIKKVHVRRAAPPVISVPVTAMGGTCGMDRYRADRHSFAGSEVDGVRIP